MKKIKKYAVNHKIITAIIIVILLFAGYFVYKKITGTEGDTRYLTTKVQKSTIIVSVSGTGQVSSLNQIDIKSKASGDVIYLGKKSGNTVTRGALIAQLDGSDAEKSVRDAEVNLESSKISLDKLKIEKSKENMDADLTKAYDDGFNSVSNVFLDLPGIMTGLNDMFFKGNITNGQWNIDWYEGQVEDVDREQVAVFKKNFANSYQIAKAAYDKSFDNYKFVSRTADSTTIEALITDTYSTTKLISDSIKSANNYIDFVDSSIQKRSTTPAIITTHKASLSTYTSKTNTHLITLLSNTTSIKNFKDAFLNSDLDIKSAELSLKQRENALQDAKDKLADYFIRATFDGTLATVNIQKGDSVGTGAVIGTLITTKQIAEISLNEVDVAKIKTGQKATLTFDAIPDLSISGVVADIDAIGTASQGVVTYNVKISFDTQDERVKPAMSVSASIITDVKQNVIVVPNSAVKSQSGISYVESFDTPLLPPTDGSIGSISLIPPNKIPIETGLSNDTETEIISGIKENDEIITRTILPSATSTTTAPSIFGGNTNSRGTSTGAVKF